MTWVECDQTCTRITGGRSRRTWDRRGRVGAPWDGGASWNVTQVIIKPSGQGRVPCSGAIKPIRVIVFSITVRIEEGPKYSNKMEVKKKIFKKNKQLQQKHN